jgi:hypothetical protein
MKNTDFYNLLVKLPNGKVIQINKMNVNISTIETLKLNIAYLSNIPYHKFELYWNDESLYPEKLFLKDIEIKGEKLPINNFNVNNLIFVIVD